jgi:hypothetical protein
VPSFLLDPSNLQFTQFSQIFQKSYGLLNNYIKYNKNSQEIMIVYEINDNFIPFSQISYIFASINIYSKFLYLEFTKFCSCNLKLMTTDKKVNIAVTNLEFYGYLTESFPPSGD